MADAVYDIEVRDRTKQGLASSEKEVKGFAGRIQRIVGGLNPTLVAGAAAAGLVAGAIGLIKSRIGDARELRNFAQIAMVSTTFLQENAIALRRTGAEQDDFIDGLREMQLRLSEAAALGSGPAVDALKLVGLSLSDITGLDAPEQFDLIRKRIASIEDPARRLFVAEELLGGSSERLQGFLALTAEQLAEYRREAHETGQVLSEDTVADLLAAGEAWDKFSGRLSGFLNQVLVAMIPGLTAILDFVEQTMIPTLDVVIGNVIAVVQAAAEGDWKEVWELMGDAVGIGSGEPGDRGQTLVDEIRMIVDGAISAVRLAGQGEWREAWAAWQEGISFVPQQSVREYVLLGAFLFGASRLVVAIARGAWAAAWVLIQLTVGFIPGGRLAMAKLSALLIAANARVLAAGGPWRLAWIAIRAPVSFVLGVGVSALTLLSELLQTAIIRLRFWSAALWASAWAGVRARVALAPFASSAGGAAALAPLLGILAAALLYVYLYRDGDWALVWEDVKNVAQLALDGIRYNIDPFVAFGESLVVNAIGTWIAIGAGWRAFRDSDFASDFIGFWRGIANGTIATFEGMANSFIRGLNAIISAWNNLSLTLPAFSVPGLGEIFGGTTFQTPNAPFIPRVSIPRLQAGGIIPGSPGGRLVIAGENNRPEAIVPLNRAGGIGGITIQSLVINALTDDPQRLADLFSFHISQLRATGELDS